MVLCPYACGPAAGTSKGHRGDARHDDRADKLVSAPTVAEMRSGEQRGAGADTVRMPTGRAGVCADHACTRSPRKRELIDRPARVNGMYCYAMLSAASEGPHPNILGAPALLEPLSRRASARFEPPGFRHHRDSLRPMPEVR